VSGSQVDELKALLNAIENQRVKERIQVLYWLKSKQLKTIEAIASFAGKHRTTKKLGENLKQVLEENQVQVEKYQQVRYCCDNESQIGLITLWATKINW
jgi:hypothetical protein